MKKNKYTLTKAERRKTLLVSPSQTDIGQVYGFDQSPQFEQKSAGKFESKPTNGAKFQPIDAPESKPTEETKIQPIDAPESKPTETMETKSLEEKTAPLQQSEVGENWKDRIREKFVKVINWLSMSLEKRLVFKSNLFFFFFIHICKSYFGR